MDLRLYVISGFRREIAENCALLDYYAASSGNSLPTFQCNLSVPPSGSRSRTDVSVYLPVPSSGSRSRADVSVQSVGSILRFNISNRRFGTTYRSHPQVQDLESTFRHTYQSRSQGQDLDPTFRYNLSVPSSCSVSPTDVSV